MVLGPEHPGRNHGGPGHAHEGLSRGGGGAGPGLGGLAVPDHAGPGDDRRFWRHLAAGVAVWFWLGGRRAVESLGYHTERGLEVESLYGGVLFLVGTIAGTKVPWVYNYNAFHVVPEWGARLALFAFPLQAAALLLVMWRFWRSGMADGLRYSAAAVLAFIVFCKVLSPQYLIWLCPFMAVLDGRTGSVARKIFLLACLTTAMFYPGPGFAMVLEHQAGPILLLNLRNVLLVWLFAMLVYCPREGLRLEKHPAGIEDAVVP